MDEEQLDQDFRKISVQALLEHLKKLGAMEEAISEAARAGTEIPHLKAIFEELANASHQLESLIEYYQHQQIPGDSISSRRRSRGSTTVQPPSSIIRPLSALPRVHSMTAKSKNGPWVRAYRRIPISPKMP